MTTTRSRDVPTRPLPPLYGLVLAGGASKRMQRDKATLEYHGRPQLAWAFEFLSSRCERTFVSVRPDQVADPLRARYPQVVDSLRDIGPIAGIAAAHSHRGVGDALYRQMSARLPHAAATRPDSGSTNGPAR